MYMGLRQFRSRIKQCAQKCRLWPLCFVLLICGCNRVNTADPLRNHYDELGVTMKNYFDEKDLPVYEGEYIEIKIYKAYRFFYKGDYRYFYDLLIAPKYNGKTVLSGIFLDAAEHPGKYDKLYYELNSSFEKLDPEGYAYKTVDKILCNEYKFCLYDNSWLYNYKIDKGTLNSCLSNMTVTVTINGKKDTVILRNIQFENGQELYKEEEIFRDVENGRLSAVIYPFVKE